MSTSSSHTPGAEEREPEPTVIRDKRRVDPATGAVRDTPPEVVVGGGDAAADGTAGTAPAPDRTAEPASDRVAEPTPDPAEEAAALAASRLEDLQRLQAEYVNYRHRVERDADLARQRGTATVFEALLPVLDDITLARQHGDLTEGPMAKIADKLIAVLEKQGLTSFGEAGEPFDPTRHEALMQQPSAEAEAETVAQVLQPGYAVGDRVLRAARVAVSVPEG